jgi:hypothetical protein
MVINTLLILLAIVVFIGLIRATFRTNDGIWDFIMDMFWIDTLGDILGWIFEHFDTD